MSTHAAVRESEAVYDYIGVGFGPSNLAVAIAAAERSAPPHGLFLEARPALSWHPGMMFDDAQMQISYLKDLVTLRNPGSPYTFLQYLKAKGRLERFVNLADQRTSRLEFQDYLLWAAEAFRHQVEYGARARRITPVTDDPDADRAFRVEVEHVREPRVRSYLTRNVIYGGGLRPNLLDGQVTPSDAIIHTHGFLERFPERFQDHDARYRLAVVGSGQSAAEVVQYLLKRYANAHVRMIIPDYALRPADSSAFVNEAFFAEEVDRFYGAGAEAGLAYAAELRNTNYGVVDGDLITQLYRLRYVDEVRGVERLSITRSHRLLRADGDGDEVDVEIEDLVTCTRTVVRVDGLVLATGYRDDVDEDLFRDVLPLARRHRDGRLALSRHYRVEMQVPTAGAVYVQGCGQSSHGPGDTLLSLLAFRSHEIVEDLSAGLARRPRSVGTAYPPASYLEDDPERLYAVIERCRFATLISALDDQPFVTHAPLILDRSRGRRGVLFGHLDRQNPHAALITATPVTAVFHGPNAYISPHVCVTDPLPTWNSIAVHVRGTARAVTGDALVRGLMSICEQADPGPGAYRLLPTDARIARLVPHIVGFEIEIEDMVGRFKLSQDQNGEDARLAREVLIRRSEEGERALIESCTGAR